jgi:micrococcal nuclease
VLNIAARVVGSLLSALMLAQPAAAPPTLGLVERVVDGDTLVLARIGAVRLIGVDTPESKHPLRPVERFSKEATVFLTTLTRGQMVSIEYDQTPRDRYGRLLAYLYLPDGRCVNAEIIRQGYGFAYVKYPFKYMDEYRALEREAREAGRGLWAAAP